MSEMCSLNQKVDCLYQTDNLLNGNIYSRHLFIIYVWLLF